MFFNKIFNIFTFDKMDTWFQKEEKKYIFVYSKEQFKNDVIKGIENRKILINNNIKWIKWENESAGIEKVVLEIKTNLCWTKFHLCEIILALKQKNIEKVKMKIIKKYFENNYNSPFIPNIIEINENSLKELEENKLIFSNLHFENISSSISRIFDNLDLDECKKQLVITFWKLLNYHEPISFFHNSCEVFKCKFDNKLEEWKNKFKKTNNKFKNESELENVFESIKFTKSFLPIMDTSANSKDILISRIKDLYKFFVFFSWYIILNSKDLSKEELSEKELILNSLRFFKMENGSNDIDIYNFFHKDNKIEEYHSLFSEKEKEIFLKIYQKNVLYIYYKQGKK